MTETNDHLSHSFWRDAGRWLTHTSAPGFDLERRGRLTASLLLVLELLTVILLAAGAFSGLEPVLPVSGALFGLALALVWPALYLLNRRGLVNLASAETVLVLLALSLLLVARAGVLSPAATILVLPVMIAGLLAPSYAPLAAAGVGMAGYLALNLGADPGYFASVLEGGAAFQTVFVYINLIIIGLVAWLFSRTARQALRERQELSLALVEQRETLMKDLETQTRQLQATIAVARAIAGQRDLDSLLGEMVNLVRDTFGYYHVQVFLVDEDQGTAELRQSTGEAGRQLLARGHRLPVGSVSVIGQVTSAGHPVIARDTDTDLVHRRNELLPDTRSEMALPLLVGGQVIGALDLQSVEPDAFDDRTIPTLQALADQLSVAIQNARLFEQAERSLQELRQLSGEVTERSWAEFLAEAQETERRQVYGPESGELAIQRSRIAERVLSAGSLIVSSGQDGQPAFLAVPLVVRDEVVGVLGVEPDGARQWSQADLDLLEGIAERTALAIENARLYWQAQRAAERERLIGDIADRLQRAPSLALLLESATRELAEALGTDHVYAEISMERPLARQRRDIPEAEDEAVDGHSVPADLPAAPGEPEEARAEG